MGTGIQPHMLQLLVDSETHGNFIEMVHPPTRLSPCPCPLTSERMCILVHQPAHIFGTYTAACSVQSVINALWQ